MYEEILYEVEDPIASITLNRPRVLNAWTNRMGVEVKHAFAQAEKDPRVVAIILTGAGRGFCAGADLKQLQSISTGEGAGDRPDDLDADPGDPSFGDDFRGHYTYPMSIAKPVIAAINGPTAGMAIPIVLACDIRFASDQASFTLAFSKRGLVAEWGVSWLLGRLVGPAHALDLLFSSRKIDAQEAERLGLVNRVVPHEELMKTAKEYVLELANQCSPASMAIMKRQVYQQLNASLGPSEQESVKLMLESFKRPDFKEGVTSFLEKRPPKFQRR